MNAETAVLVGIVLAVIMVAGVYAVFSGGMTQAGESLFGSDSESGFFDTPEGMGEDTKIPTGGTSDTDSAMEVKNYAGV